MFKLLVMGVIVGTLSDLTGIPLFPISLRLQRNELTFEAAKVDEKQLERFKDYLRTKI